MKINVDDGKYTFQTAEDGCGVDVLRYGKPWIESATGSNAIHAMMYELDAARLVVQAARQIVDPEGDIADVVEFLRAALKRHSRLVDDRELPSEWTLT